MKKNTRIISVVLCLLLAVSVFSTTAGAKSKGYVKSISVKSKATITIPLGKKTATKAFKVTVKVSGNAGKKFTAKSNKAAVASVKVSGSKIKVTAKKAGKAVITVKTKAKGKNGKALSKKLTVTVKKKTVVANLKKLKDYIQKYGYTNSEGNKYISLSESGDEEPYAIEYNKSKNVLSFVACVLTKTSYGDIEQNGRFDLEFKDNKSVKFYFWFSDPSEKVSATIKLASFTKKTELVFSFQKPSTSDDLYKEKMELYDAKQGTANAFLQAVLAGIDLTLYCEPELTLNDIGFIKY